MLLYRLGNHKFIDDLSGEGARRFGGRWNEIGMPAIYTSNSLSLAFLEILCHIKPSLIKNNFSVLVLEFDSIIGGLDRLHETDLPTNWNDYPAPEEIVNIGTKWLKQSITVGLGVPSAAMPFANNNEFNVLLNPNHHFFDRCVTIKDISPFAFDERMIGLG